MSKSLTMTGSAIVTMPEIKELIVVTPAIVVVITAVVRFLSVAAVVNSGSTLGIVEASLLLSASGFCGGPNVVSSMVPVEDMVSNDNAAEQSGVFEINSARPEEDYIVGSDWNML